MFRAEGDEMGALKYDKEADCLYVSISGKEGYSTVEISRKIAVDIDRSNRILGVELVDASKVISELFQEKVAKEDIQNLLCKIEEGETLNLRFAFRGERGRHATLSLPKFYQSPVLSVS